MENFFKLKKIYRTKRCNRIKKPVNPVEIILFAVLILYSVLMLTLLIWALLTSVRTRGEFVENVFGFPKEWAFSNYITAFNFFSVQILTSTMIKTVYLDQMFLYSLFYAVGGATVTTLVHCLTAYVVQRFRRYKLSSVLTWVVIVTMILPIVGSLPSKLQVMHALSLYDNFFGVFLLQASFLGMHFLIFKAAFSAIPESFSEAALVDGAGNFSLMFRIALPLVRKTFMILWLLSFIGLWNDYQGPMIYLPSYPTVAYGLYRFSQISSGELNSIPMRMAGCMLLFIPIFIIYLCLQDKLMGNLTIGGVKG